MGGEVGGGDFVHTIGRRSQTVGKPGVRKGRCSRNKIQGAGGPRGRRTAATGLFALGITRGAGASSEGKGQMRASAPQGGQACPDKGHGRASGRKRKLEPLVRALPSRHVH